MVNNNQSDSILSRLIKAVRGKGVDADPDMEQLLDEAESSLKEETNSSEPCEDKRELPEGVSKIVLDAGGIKVKLRQGPGRFARLRGVGKASLANVTTEVTDGTLTISNFSKEGVFVYNHNGVTVTQNIGGAIHGVVAGGSISIGKHYRKHIGGNDVNREPVYFSPGGKSGMQAFSLVEIEIELPSVASLNIRGAGDIDYTAIDCGDLEVDISGAGTVRLEGKADRLDAEVSGAGNIKGKSLMVQNAKLRVSGAGNVAVNVARSLKARISGTGNVNVYGNPPEKDQRVSGVGSINFH